MLKFFILLPFVCWAWADTPRQVVLDYLAAADKVMAKGPPISQSDCINRQERGYRAFMEQMDILYPKLKEEVRLSEMNPFLLLLTSGIEEVCGRGGVWMEEEIANSTDCPQLDNDKNSAENLFGLTHDEIREKLTLLNTFTNQTESMIEPMFDVAKSHTLDELKAQETAGVTHPPEVRQEVVDNLNEESDKLIKKLNELRGDIESSNKALNENGHLNSEQISLVSKTLRQLSLGFFILC